MSANNKTLSVINVGLDTFLPAFEQTGTPCAHLAWRPPAQGNTELTDILFALTVGYQDQLGQSRIDAANAEALRRVLAGQPVLKRVRPAHECIPVLNKTTLLHAGPPIHWNDMCHPMRGAIIGALKYEGLAESDAEAQMLMDSGRIFYGPTHPHAAVCPMAGVLSYSMPLLVVENESFGVKAFSTLNEGVGRVLRFGANGPAVIQQLHWMGNTLAPALDAALERSGGIALKNIMAQALAMGDELHQRNIAAGLLFYKTLCRELDDAASTRQDAARIMQYLSRDNEQFFLNMAMAACRSMLIPAENIPDCSMITAMSRNGVHFGVTVSALGGRWFTAPSLNPKGIYFPGYDEQDANPDMGDSAIVECCGLGGFAMGTAPAVARFVGAEGGLERALRFTRDMGRICVGSNPDLPMPNLDFSGVPTGIDVRKVVATGILPVINSGVAHRQAGIGQVGAGLVTPPMDAMHSALRAFHAELSRQSRQGGASAAAV